MPSDAEFEQRWRAWLARGAAHERVTPRRMRVAVPARALVAALTLYGLVLASPAGTP